MSSQIGQSSRVSEEDLLRARFYSLLAQLLSQPPGPSTLANLSHLEGNDSPIGAALADLAAVASRLSPSDAEDEFNRLFIGLTEGEVRPYGSYYQTGFLYDKPLADLRWDMEALGIARAEDVPEPEDHIAALCEIMHGLITGAYGAPAGLETQRTFFDAHIDGWASRFFRDLESAAAAELYRPIGAIGRIFVEIEREAFGMVEALVDEEP